MTTNVFGTPVAFLVLPTHITTVVSLHFLVFLAIVVVVLAIVVVFLIARVPSMGILFLTGLRMQDLCASSL